MYQRYWHLARSPFENSLDPGDFVPTSTHQGALLKLQYAVEHHKGLAVLTSGHGMGKTFLTHVLETELGAGFGPMVRILFPQMSPAEMLGYTAIRIGCSDPALASRQCGVDQILRLMEGRLRQFADEGARPVIVIDDAHLLQPEHLQTLQLFLNLQQHCGDVCTVILAGRPDLLARLQRMAGLDQRVSVRMALHPLTEEDVARYVQERLERAGDGGGAIFDEEAIHTLWELSQGNPRRLNQISDLALLVGFADNLSSVTPIELEAAALELTGVSND